MTSEAQPSRRPTSSRSTSPARRPARTERPTQAERAEIHRLYQEAVQCPESDCEFFETTYRKLRGRAPVTMREDFCGTAHLSVEWCRSDPARKAIGVDLDGPTLEWGRENEVGPYAEELGKRIKLVHADVLEPQRFKADLTCALNFSFCVFKERADLKRYLELAHAGLKRNGLLFLEICGGTEAITMLEEERECDDFTYVWQQETFDPMTAETLCKIHFQFPDGSKIQDAFVYDWRLWTVPEIRDLLHEVGFADTKVFWERLDDEPDEDGTRHGSGEYEEAVGVEQQESWLAYVVGMR